MVHSDAHRNPTLRAGNSGRRHTRLYSLPRRLSHARPAGRRKVRHDREPHPKSVHDGARLAVWLGGFPRLNGHGHGPARGLPAPRRGGSAMKRAHMPLAIYALSAYLFLHLPLLILAAFSFNESRFTVWQGFSLRWYSASLHDSQLMDASWNSLLIAVFATLASTIIGTLCAYGLWKRTSPVLAGSLYLSLVTPEIVTGISLLAFYQWIFRFLQVQLGMHTVILAHISFSISFVVIVVMARLRTVDGQLEEAALDLGANHWQAFRYVTLPVILPGVIAATLP